MEEEGENFDARQYAFFSEEGPNDGLLDGGLEGSDAAEQDIVDKLEVDDLLENGLNDLQISGELSPQSLGRGYDGESQLDRPSPGDGQNSIEGHGSNKSSETMQDVSAGSPIKLTLQEDESKGSLGLDQVDGVSTSSGLFSQPVRDQASASLLASLQRQDTQVVDQDNSWSLLGQSSSFLTSVPLQTQSGLQGGALSQAAQSQASSQQWEQQSLQSHLQSLQQQKQQKELQQQLQQIQQQQQLNQALEQQKNAALLQQLQQQHQQSMLNQQQQLNLQRQKQQQQQLFQALLLKQNQAQQSKAREQQQAMQILDSISQKKGVPSGQTLQALQALQQSQPQQQLTQFESQLKNVQSAPGIMTHLQVEQIRRMQQLQQHSLQPYLDDYYYQAAQNKFNGANSNAFCPPALSTAQQPSTTAQQVNFVNVSGLGKIPVTNLRTQRPMLDIQQGQSNIQDYQRLLQESNALRSTRSQGLDLQVTIDNCFQMLQHIDDIDRLIARRSMSSQDLLTLLKKRTTLLSGLATSITGDQRTSFVKYMESPKGRQVLSKALEVLNVPSTAKQAIARTMDQMAITALKLLQQQPASPLLLSVLLHAKALFSVKPKTQTEQLIFYYTTQIASHCCDCIKQIESAPVLVECIEALVQGDMNITTTNDGGLSQQTALIPFNYPVDSSGRNSPWLQHVVVQLLDHGKYAVSVGWFTGSPDMAQRWENAVDQVYLRVREHLELLQLQLAQISLPPSAVPKQNIVHLSRSHIPADLVQQLQSAVGPCKLTQLQQIMSVLSA